MNEDGEQARRKEEDKKCVYYNVDDDERRVRPSTWIPVQTMFVIRPGISKRSAALFPFDTVLTALEYLQIYEPSLDAQAHLPYCPWIADDDPRSQ